MSYRPPVSRPCSSCPFRRKSLAGWLGRGSPESFISCIQSGEPLPCHQTIDYDDPRWSGLWAAQEVGSMCAGSLVFMANKMQRPRSNEFPTMLPDKSNVFTNAIEFVRHHREAPVRSWDDADQNNEAKLHREMIKRAAKVGGNPIIEYGVADDSPKLYKAKSVQADLISNNGACGSTLDHRHVCILKKNHKGDHQDGSRHLHWNKTHWWHDTLR